MATESSQDHDNVSAAAAAQSVHTIRMLAQVCTFTQRDRGHTSKFPSRWTICALKGSQAVITLLLHQLQIYRCGYNFNQFDVIIINCGPQNHGIMK